MAETPSAMIPLGTLAPDFQLFDTVTQSELSLQKLKSEKATVIMFLSNHCPYVKHILPKLIQITDHYQKQGVSSIAICSNDVENYPEDGPEKMATLAKKLGFSFPYLYDPTQKTAKAYRAACTPDFFVFDKELRCIYRGRFDNATPGNGHPITGNDLCEALDNLLQGKPITKDQKPSLGCNIKWKLN